MTTNGAVGSTRQRSAPPEAYPPRVLKTRLGELMRDRHLTDRWLCEFLDIVPLTARRLREGKDLKLTEAFRLSRYFKLPIEEIWSSR